MGTAHNLNGRRFDDRLFTTVLSSAYSLQQQHDRIRSKARPGRFSEIISEAIATQSLIRKRNLDLDTAMHLVVNRTQKLARAAGAAIALVSAEHLDYKVGTGLGAMLLGLKVPASTSISFERLRSEPWVETDTWQDVALARRLVAKVLTAPIYCHGVLAGCIQLFCRIGRFDPDGVHACELMASIVSQSLAAGDFRQSGGNFMRAVAGKWDTSGMFARDPRFAAEDAESESEAAHWLERQVAIRLERELKKPAASARSEDEVKASPGGFTTKWPTLPIAEDMNVSSGEEESEQDPDFEDSIFEEEAATEDQDVEHASILGSRLKNPFAVPDGWTRTLPVFEPAPVASLPTRDSGRPANGPGASGPLGDDHAKVPVRGRHGWNRLRVIAYPVFVLIFATLVRVNAGAHSWWLELLLYVLVVITTLEVRRQLLKR